MKETGEMAKYRILQKEERNLVRFFCAASGAAVYTAPLPGVKCKEKEVLELWQAEGKACFHLCKFCDRWVSDPMFNPDVCRCVDCAPWEEEPNYCFRCGEPIREKRTHCKRCGTRLRYGEVWI